MRAKGLILLLAAWLALTLLSVWLVNSATLTILQSALQQSLPQRLADAGINQLGNPVLVEYLKNRIEADLAELQPGVSRPQLKPPLLEPSLVKHCSVRVLRLQGITFALRQSGEHFIQLDWHYNDHHEQLDLTVSCTLDWPRLLISQLLLVLAGLGLISCIPAPLSAQRKTLIERLTRSGLSRRRARHLTRQADHFNPLQWRLSELLTSCTDMPPEEMMGWIDNPRLAYLDSHRLPWFVLGLQRHRDNIEAALAIAEAEPDLILDPADCTAHCHGVAVPLPSTPFFYYYWYAMRRVDHENAGWFTNPHANGSDTSAAEELIALMERHDGHHKAVKDLRDKGLRAKTLDQNRSKVKDEIVNALGEELARDYLFEMARDPRTARYNYRLTLSPERIQLRSEIVGAPVTR